ncbi:ADP-ribose pyrophosphatase YjhB, NUDIX family [Micromonospora pattaloongensis]|uniref:ADP-ribose pyrophosphatase YjhB, NUDIX family n=1 Tax=Micromonospora pattaloongensis TaxID=405436 RepID=A0A1H3LXM7_9ACTN|nr:NUDIX domain-containing protein [Micromonospora pattaloongensis]SDY69182.1 ADP-ribose pyrophosphatase YjhB, NUDIX family [Micromonospora pattaloongensis]
MSRRVDYYNDPNAPAANSIVPGGSALVVDDEGRILMQRRADSGNWSLPGGTMEIGETLADAVVREVREETGLDVETTGILGVYTDPNHVIAYADGEVRQEFNVTFIARPIRGAIAVSDESTDVRFIPSEELQRLPIHETVRLRIRHYLERRIGPFIG